MEKKFRTLLIVASLLSCLLTSCNDYRGNKEAHTISSYLKNNTDFEFVDTCYVDMSKILGVRYDTLYFFSGITPPEIIAEKIHLPYNNSWLRDDQYRLILVRDDEVVYDIDMRRNHCNWHLPEDEAITEHIFMVVKPYDRYELIPKK